MLGVTLVIMTEVFNYLHPLKVVADALITSRAVVNITDVGKVISIRVY